MKHYYCGLKKGERMRETTSDFDVSIEYYLLLLVTGINACRMDVSQLLAK